MGKNTNYNTGMPCFNGEPKEVIAFARAILKAAGVEELERDAERYRWLVEHGEGIGIYERSFGGDCWKVSDPDAAIDESMKAK